MPEPFNFRPPTGRGQSGDAPLPAPAAPERYRAKPYAAESPRGNVPSLPGNPGAPKANIPTGPYNDPKDSHPGPIGPPAVHVWQELSSSEYIRTHTERPQSPNPQGMYDTQTAGQTRGDLRAPDPKWKPETVIRTMHPPVASQLIGRPFDQKMTPRMTGEHGSMAGRRRNYQLQLGERPVHRLTNTYRIVPPTRDDVLAGVRGQPKLEVDPIPDRSQNGTWRLI